MSFKPVQKLIVRRTLSTGEEVPVGVLAQNRQGVFFQYDAQYLAHFGNLSPFTLDETTALQMAPGQPHDGIHGVFADSLPDGWGLLLQDRIFRQQGISPAQLTAMDRLAFVGAQGMGALAFSPVSEWKPGDTQDVDLATLGLEAQTLFDQGPMEDLDGPTGEVLGALVAVGSCGGARPKVQVFMRADNFEQCRTRANPEDEAWLVKFTSRNLALGHEEGLCEAVYLQMAEQANLQPPSWRLVPAPERSGAVAWLAVKRFDYLPVGSPANPKTTQPGRRHMHSACGLLDADFRTPSLDYVDLIKASRQVCKAPSVGQLQFRRAVFNLFAANQDDHSKNWSFLQSDEGSWQVAPFYDVTFSPHPLNEHATAFDGHGRQPPLKTMQKLAATAGFASWKEAQHSIHEVVDVVSRFSSLARDQGIKKSTIETIQRTLGRVYTLW